MQWQYTVYISSRNASTNALFLYIDLFYMLWFMSLQRGGGRENGGQKGDESIISICWGKICEANFTNLYKIYLKAVHENGGNCGGLVAGFSQDRAMSYATADLLRHTQHRPGPWTGASTRSTFTASQLQITLNTIALSTGTSFKQMSDRLTTFNKQLDSAVKRQECQN